jgi:1-acyl-sn-glycerol-3-phosphate acyltransferase
MILKPLFVGFFGIRGQGFESIPRQGGLIIICNHFSAFDPPVVASLMPRPVYFMTKSELFRFRPFGFVIRALHAYPVRRGTPDRAALRHSLELLKANQILLIFPEGHRTETGQLQPARSGTVFLGKRSGCAIVPVGIVGQYGFRRGIRYYVGEAFVIPEDMPTGEAQHLLVGKIRQQIERGRDPSNPADG